MASSRLHEPPIDTEDIQGNVAPGFKSAHLRLVGLRIPEGAAPHGRGFLNAHQARVTTMHDLLDARARPRRPTHAQLNICLSFHGLVVLGQEGADRISDTWFKRGMWSVSGTLGDPPAESDEYMGRDEQSTPHLLAILGADDKATVEEAHEELVGQAIALGLRVCFDQPGARLDGGTEHFGFREGVSNPAIRGRDATGRALYPSRFEADEPLAERFARPGQPLVWPGQLVFGYAGESGRDSTGPGPTIRGGPEWLRNGSLLVFRRFRQDVAEFRRAMASTAADLGIDAARLEAMVVGRWPNGNPLVRHAEHPGPAERMADEHFAYRSETSDVRVKDESGHWQDIGGAPADLDGRRCPRFAHIRQVNPRDAPTDAGGWPAALGLQIVRRGIPFGPSFDDDPTNTDRGLLFLAYASGIENRFGVLSAWLNHGDAPEPGRPGVDLLAGSAPRNGGPRTLVLRGKQGDVTADVHGRWVEPTGGGFFLSPSLTLLRALGREASSEGT